MKRLVGGIRLFYVSLFSLSILTSCRTVNSASIPTAEAAGLYDILKDDESLQEEPPCHMDSASAFSRSYYIFIRLYDPVYKNPFYMSTFLKGGIAATEVHPQLKLSHASLGLDLTDNFFGLTLMPRPMLNMEHATEADANEFMKQCRMDKSSQTTFALTVTKEEYEKVKQVLYEYRDAKYSTGKVVLSGLKSIRRKMRAKKNRSLEIALATKKGAAGIAQKMDKERKFTCSSFTSFVLYNSVDKIREYFDKNTTNLNYVSVTDLAYLPGVKLLFSSSWQDYNRVAQTYAEEHEEFLQYTSRKE